MRTIIALSVAGGVLLLSACAGGADDGDDRQAAAQSYCQEQVTATFDDAESAEFSEWSDGGDSADERSADEGSADQRYEFESTVDADGQTFDLTCTVTGESGSFRLESYLLTPR